MMRRSPRQIEVYYRQIDRMHARRMLALFNVFSAPHRKEEDQRDLIDDLSRRADGRPETVIDIHTNEDLQQFLRGRR